MSHLHLRIDITPQARLGPGKVRLLELIAEHGSIAAAGRAMGMSYRRAWLLINDLNRCFRDPLVLSQQGGSRGGGASLTALGHDVVQRYRAVEAAAADVAAAHLIALRSALAGDP